MTTLGRTLCVMTCTKGKVVGLAAAALVAAAGASTAAAQKAQGYVAEPMPPGVQVVQTERDGFLFADAKGHTLYDWPRGGRGGQGGGGDFPGKSACTDHRITVTAGEQTPWPAGLTVPNAEHRPTCTQVWPPLYADAGAKSVGAWSVITRDDGKTQWAYRNQAVYTSWLDHGAGDVNGASKVYPSGESGGREPIGPTPDIPPGFAIASTINGQMLRAADGAIVYTSDRDGTNKSNCAADCLEDWKPILAYALAASRGQFTVFERAPGIQQWAFRGKPLYTRVQLGAAADVEDEGGDVAGWHEVYTQKVLPPPKEFTRQQTLTGLVLADAHGKPIYIYNCVEDTEDQLACDYPDAPQDYRLAICGDGDPVRCEHQFPYVRAAKDAKSKSHLWSVMWINPLTGHRASKGQLGAISVWAYRERPVYTYSGDVAGGELPLGFGFGEYSGRYNGYTAFMIDNFFRDE